MVSRLLAEAQLAQLRVSQAISCSFTPTVSPGVPSLRKKVEKDLNHQQGAEEGRSKSTQPLLRDCAQRSDAGNRSAEPSTPGLCTYRMVADGRTHTRMPAHPAHAERPQHGTRRHAKQRAANEHAHIRARRALHSLACTPARGTVRGACPNTERSTPQAVAARTPRTHTADPELRTDQSVRARPGTRECASASASTYPANQQFGRSKHKREAGVDKLECTNHGRMTDAGGPKVKLEQHRHPPA